VRYLWRAPATVIAVLLSAFFLSTTLFVHETDVLHILSVVEVLEDHEPYDVDDFVVVLLMSGGLVVDVMIASRGRKRALEIQEQRLRVFKVTMRTVHDIVNHYLNNLQLFRLESETALPAESIALFDQLLHDTATELQVLGNLDDTPEPLMASGPGIDCTKGAMDHYHSR
jgi:hypothetical protein